jgi:hypothetical protein
MMERMGRMVRRSVKSNSIIAEGVSVWSDIKPDANYHLTRYIDGHRTSHIKLVPFSCDNEAQA